MIGIRRVTTGDAAELSALLRANRSYLEPWDPQRDPAFWTEAGQRRILVDQLRHEHSIPHVIVEDDRIVGRANLSNVVRGPFLSAGLGYWVAQDCAGRGVATTAVAAVVRAAFTEHGLHRVEAGTLLHNTGSQRVLQRNGFVFFGMAPGYLNIAGRWQDHNLYQLLAENWLATQDGGS